MQKAAAAGAPPEEREDDDAEGDGAEAGASFDYLLSMPIHSLTHEKVPVPQNMSAAGLPACSAHLILAMIGGRYDLQFLEDGDDVKDLLLSR